MVTGSLRVAALAAALALAPAAPAGAREAAPAVAFVEDVDPGARDAAATVDAFHAALRRGDTEAAAALVADDALVFEEGRAERSKAEYAAQHLAADAAFSKAVPGAATRRRGSASGDMAWIATEGRTRGRYKGTEVNRVTDETMVLRRAGGAWKIVHIHWSSAQSGTE